MSNVDFGDNMVVRADLIKRTWERSMKASKSQDKGKKQYRSEKAGSRSLEVVFSFPATWDVKDWLFNNDPFGKVAVDLHLFPCLKHVGLKKTASVNEAFLRRFKDVLSNRKFRDEVDKAVRDGKKIVFTGHSNGGAISILATLWFLEHYIRPDPNKLRPLCITFGSPLVGDHIFTHAINRENWSRYFIHFIMRHDIFPRISFSSLSSIQLQLPRILSFMKSPAKEHPGDYLAFFDTVVSNALSVSSYAASKMIGSRNPLMEVVSGFIELSPYRPSGTYVFCPGTGELVAVKNSDAVLQLLFYTIQLNSTDSVIQIAERSLKCHLNYDEELAECLTMRSITFLDNLDSLPLSSDLDNIATATMNKALNDLGLSTTARLCLRAAGELEKLKQENLNKLEQKRDDKDKGIKKNIEKLEEYKNKCAHRSTTYYDSFKTARLEDDFRANVCRLQLAGMWDEIEYMIKRYELPDGFECRKDWIDLGTRYRHLVEPVDIANYYRQSLNKDTGPYMGRGRPKRYKIAQRWLEHDKRMQNEALESCFWAEAEELRSQSSLPEVRENVLSLISKVQNWVKDGVLDDHMYFEGSTFMKLLKEHFP